MMKNALLKLTREPRRFLKTNQSVILTCIAGLGVIGTMYLTSKAAVKADKALKEATDEKGEELTTMEVVTVVAPIYAPAGAACVGTLICMAGVCSLDRKQQASLVSAYTLLEKSYKDYKEKVKEIYGSEAEENVEKEIAWDKFQETDIISRDGRALFALADFDVVFESTLEDVIKAEYELNRYFVGTGSATLNNLLTCFGVDPIDGGDDIGWSIWCEGYYGYKWVDFYNEELDPDEDEPDVEHYLIHMPFGPTADYLDPEGDGEW